MSQAYSYFPGCSLKGLGRAYEESFLAVFRALGVEIQELEDWNCCGATAYMSIKEEDATRLAARNLCIAEQAKKDLITPCAGCYLVLNKSQHYLKKYPPMAESVKAALKAIDLHYEGTAKVRHPLDVLLNDIGPKVIKEKVRRPLTGLKVACYYGCQIVRPFSVFDDQHDPATMDELLTAVGAEAVHFPLKTKCCGGSMTGTIPEVGQRLCYILLKEASKRGADLIATACPLCQFNLEAYQDKINKKYDDVTMPVVYFTQLLGLALGLSSRELGLHRQIVSGDKIFKEKVHV